MSVKREKSQVLVIELTTEINTAIMDFRNCSLFAKAGWAKKSELHL